MRIHIAAAALFSLALSPQSLGVISKVTAGAPDATGTVQFTVDGTNPCGAVHMDYGDGAAVVHAISAVPATMSYEYTRVGEYLVHAKGMGNCEGSASTTVRVDRVRRRPLSGEEVRVGARRPDDWSLEQFPLFDTNRDNFITRGEWPAEPADFARVDRNRDDRISRDEFVNGDPDGRGALMTTIVDSREDWTETGVNVRRGETLVFDATGTIYFSSQSPATGPDGAAGRQAPAGSPMPRELIGALIARVGRSAPFLVGSGADGLRAPVDGPVYLRINDDVLDDNRGEFHVIISVTPRR